MTHLPYRSLLLAVTLAALVACDKNKPDMEQAPPPADPYADTGFEPVQVTPTPGNDAGYVEPTPMPADAAGSSYTIQKGDTLWSIARKHYGSGTRWQDIAAANPGLDPQKLPVGKTITLP